MQLKLPWALNRAVAPEPQAAQEEEQFIPAFGAKLDEKENKTCRLAFQNVNGLQPSHGLISVGELGCMEELGIDLLGLIETNINWDYNQTEALVTTANLRFNAARCITSSCPTKSKNTYLPGGTAMIATGSLCGRLQQRGSDPLGRFTWMALRSRKGGGILIITAYRVCQSAGTKAGENTAYMQQWEAMRANGITSPDPRNMILDDISALIMEWGQLGYHPLVMLDANSTLTETNMASFVQKHGLIDLVSKNNEGQPPRTYTRGSLRIDFPLGDEFINEAVIKSGILAAQDGVAQSDHTLQFIDLDIERLFGGESFIPIMGYEREFRLSNIKKKEKFQQTLLQIYEHQQIPQRVLALAQEYEIKQSLSLEDIAKYQALDYEIVCAIKAAAKSTGRKNFGYQRSPTLTEAGERIRLHKAIASCVRNSAPITGKIKELAKKLKYAVPDIKSLSIKQAVRNVQEAWRTKRQVQQDDANHRAAWLEELAQETAAATNDDAEKVLKQMIQRARMKGTFKKLSSIFKPDWSALDYIEVPEESWLLATDSNELFHFDNGIFTAHNSIDENVFDSFGTIKVPPENAKVVKVEESGDAYYVTNPESNTEPTWIKVTDPEEIEDWLLRRNKRHLQQMYIEGSPPTTDFFAPFTDEYGTSPMVDQLLDGTLDLESMDIAPELRTFLQLLKMSDEEKKLKAPSEMPVKAFQKVMAATKEETSSSPSGLHYTLWKAIAEVDELSAVHAKWASLPFMYGFVCSRWQHIIDCMLEKKKGVRKIHILRIIGLIEAEFNASLKYHFAKNILPNAEMTGVDPNQWGGRNGRSAPMCALRKIVTWEISRYTKEDIASFPGDLQSNFDRMIPSMNSIFMQRKGAPKSVCKSRAQTVMGFIRQVRTAAGTSTRTYEHQDGDWQLGGEVQGKGDCMQLWILQSDILLKAHAALCKGVTLIDVTKRLVSRRSGDAYVDDKDTLASGPVTNTAEETCDNLQHHAQTWSTLVEYVGQAFAFHKCFWQLLHWIPVAGYFLPASRTNYRHIDIRIKDHRGNHAIIKHKGHNEPNEGLGMKICPSGNQKPEFDHRLQQASSLASKVATRRLAVHEAWIALKVCVLPSLAYPFVLTCFTYNQLKRLAIIIDAVFLPKLGINRNTPKAVVYSPVELGEMDYPDLISLQDQRGITFLLRQFQQQSVLATDMKILLSHAQLESGLTKPILDDTSLNVTYLEPGLISHLRYRLHDIGASIDVEDTWVPTLQRDGDMSIMEALLRLPNVKKSELAHANQCRKWLRVITIAELANIEGTHIPANRFTGRWRAKSTLKWPRQPAPTQAMWTIWRRLVKRAFCEQNKRTWSTCAVPLDNTLGQWIYAERHINYSGYRTQQKLYEREPNSGTSSFIMYQRTEHPNEFHISEELCHELPHNAHPAEIECITGGRTTNTEYWFSSTRPIKRGAIEDERAQTLDTSHFDHIDTLITCSDGSFDPISRKAAFNWRMVTETEEGLVTLSAPIQTNPKYMNAYRAELAGLRSLVRTLRKRNLHTKKIQLNCDSKSCIDFIIWGKQNGWRVNPDQPEADLWRSIFAYLCEFEEVEPNWVLGHQDDHTEYDDLPLPVRLNIDCDTAAKECMRQSILSPERPAPIEGAGATLYLGNNMATTEIPQQIKVAKMARQMMDYTCNKFEWTDRQYAAVNWDAIGRVKKRMKIHESIRTSKMLFDWLNVGRQKKLFRQDPICPCCGTEEEDFLHLYHCSNEKMQETLAQEIKRVKGDLVRDGVPSQVYNAFIQSICASAHAAHPDPSFCITCTDTLDAMEQQRHLGTEAVLKGLLHVDWTHVLHKYWTSSSNTRTSQSSHKKDANVQTTALIKGSWSIFEALWKTRNDILHGSENELTERAHTKTMERLLEFRVNRNLMLAPADRFIIEYPVSDIMRWARDKKNALLRKLENLHKIYKGEMSQDKTQRSITDFFEVIQNAVEGPEP